MDSIVLGIIDDFIQFADYNAAIFLLTMNEKRVYSPDSRIVGKSKN